MGDDMKVFIIGGGASGLVCAIKSKTSNNEVTILERNNKCGKKILMTGNGHCNYFNEDFTTSHYHSSNLDILGKIINDENKKEILSFFDSIGIVPKIQNNYYYPITNQAITIQESLVREAKRVGVNIINDVLVSKITYKDKYYIETNKGIYESDIVVLASGSKAAPKTGSDGIGYEISTSFNHHIIKPLPSLVQLKGSEHYLKEWQGIRTDAKLSLVIDNKVVKEEVGEIQLTDYGISGIVTYQLSSIAIRALKEHQVWININFLPWIDDIKAYLDERDKKLDLNISELLDGILNYKLSNLILKKNKINYEKKYHELSDIEKNNLIRDLTSFRFVVQGYNDFDSAQVCSGGILLKEININTMESLYQPNLYIIGELLDVDGECGGYNLGFAWLTGILASLDIRSKHD